MSFSKKRLNELNTPVLINSIEDLALLNAHDMQLITFKCKICGNIETKKYYQIKPNFLYCKSCRHYFYIYERLNLIKQDIINYYSNHSVSDTAKHFVTNINTFKKWLLINKIELHTYEENIKFGVDKNRNTCMERYGTINGGCSKEALEKIRKTTKEHYGVESYLNSEEINKMRNSLEIQQKNKETQQKQFNGKWFTQTAEYLEKTKKTCKEKYGVESYSKTIKWKEKTEQTNLEKYGEISYSKTEEYKERVRQTNFQKYGVEYVSQASEIKEKIKQTNLEKYGVTSPSKNIIIKNKIKQTIFNNFGTYHIPTYKFIYNNQYFDSFPELCLYIYCKENNIEIIREPAELTFTFEDKEYHYYPDFLVNNQLIEIKGKQFLKEDGTWCNPYDHSLDKLFEAKHQCALKNNVKILYKDEYQKYIDWFNEQNYKKEDFLIK